MPLPRAGLLDELERELADLAASSNRRVGPQGSPRIYEDMEQRERRRAEERDRHDRTHARAEEAARRRRPVTGASVRGTWSASNVSRIAPVERASYDSQDRFGLLEPEPALLWAAALAAGPPSPGGTPGGLGSTQSPHRRSENTQSPSTMSPATVAFLPPPEVDSPHVLRRMAVAFDEPSTSAALGSLAPVPPRTGAAGPPRRLERVVLPESDVFAVIAATVSPATTAAEPQEQQPAPPAWLARYERYVARHTGRWDHVRPRVDDPADVIEVRRQHSAGRTRRCLDRCSAVPPHAPAVGTWSASRTARFDDRVATAVGGAEGTTSLARMDTTASSSSPAAIVAAPPWSALPLRGFVVKHHPVGAGRGRGGRGGRPLTLRLDAARSPRSAIVTPGEAVPRTVDCSFDESRRFEFSAESDVIPVFGPAASSSAPPSRVTPRSSVKGARGTPSIRFAAPAGVTPRQSVVGGIKTANSTTANSYSGSRADMEAAFDGALPMEDEPSRAGSPMLPGAFM